MSEGLTYPQRNPHTCTQASILQKAAMRLLAHSDHSVFENVRNLFQEMDHTGTGELSFETLSSQHAWHDRHKHDV